MRTKHAQRRAQQRGVKKVVENLLHVYGDRRYAPNGCILKFFSRRSIARLEDDFGPSFVAKNHENLRSYLIESKDDKSIVTIGKLYEKQRVTSSKVNKIRH